MPHIALGVEREYKMRVLFIERASHTDFVMRVNAKTHQEAIIRVMDKLTPQQLKELFNVIEESQYQNLIRANFMK